MERYVAFLRAGPELRKIAAEELFDTAQIQASKGKPQIAFLSVVPKGAARREALQLATEDDRLAVDSRQLYWLPSGGISESELDLATLESALGAWTMRTKGTVDQIAAKHFTG